jgi:class 3 adenylate cyclase
VARRVDGLAGAPGRFARNISVATRLALVVVLVALLSVVVTSLVGLERGRSLANDEIEDRLSALTAARADQVEGYVAGLQRSITLSVLTPRPGIAIGEFAQVFRDLEAEGASPGDRAEVESYYADVVAPELSAARGRPVSSFELVPVSDAAITLQARYVVPDAEGGSPSEAPAAWVEVHDPLDDAFRAFAERVGFDDVYLIEPDEEVVVYSTAKDIDFGTSLRSGPHAGSTLASLVGELATDPTPGATAVRDFAQYAPTGDRPSLFVGSPVFVGGELAGYMAARVTPDELTAILTDDEDWTGLGDAGETYVVAADNLMRSDSRAFLEERSSYVDRVREAGTATDEEIRSMELFDTTVLFQPVDYRQVDDAFAGRTGVDEGSNYLGEDVLQNRRVVEVEGLDWAVFADAPVDEIMAPIDDFVRNLLVAIAVFIVVVTFLAVRWADRLLEPLRIIAARLRSIRAGGEVSDRTELPRGSAEEFVELNDDIDLMLATLRERTETARHRADERRRVLRRLLPPSIAERAEAGDRDVIEQVSVATVVVIVLGGLGSLITSGSPDRARHLLDRFVDEADDIAAERGLDRVQLTGDAYVAACGVSRPHLDHASRAAAFVLEVREMLRDLDGDLSLTAGLDAGPISVGLTGGSRLVHDTWGVTVQRATDLARSAPAGQVLVSDACRVLLPAAYDLRAVDDDTSELVGLATDLESVT